MRIAIVDYGLGNLLNVQRALAAVQIESVITKDPGDINAADGIVLPGVGAFGEGMRNLERSGLASAVKQAAERGKPLLGICLGMQLLMEESEEFGRWPGLGLLRGRVVRFDEPSTGTRLKIPQIGWNRIAPPANAGTAHWQGSILDGLADGTFMYFVHSYYVKPENSAECFAETEYGHNRFCAVVGKRNIMGCQFHPEKSSEAGLRILRNFAGLLRATVRR